MVIPTLILRALAASVAWLLDRLPAWTPPAFLTGSGAGTLNGYATEAAGWTSGFGAWISVSTLSTCIGVTLATFAVAVGIRVGRFVINAIRGGTL